jgi:hypothetical protein
MLGYLEENTTRRLLAHESAALTLATGAPSFEGQGDLAPQEEPISVMDLENQVSNER